LPAVLVLLAVLLGAQQPAAPVRAAARAAEPRRVTHPAPAWIPPAAPGRQGTTFLLDEPFTGATAADWVFGGATYLTGSSDDPANEGWLRLTSATPFQRGFAYYDKPLPTRRGLVITFDYASWGGSGADGLSFYLFDGTTRSFNEGAYGGSLGYAQQTGIPGLSNGYLGLGLDEFGNYSNPTEGRTGGTGFIPQAVVMRGPGNQGAGYVYLAGTTSLTNPPLSLPALDCTVGLCGSTRPAYAAYFREVQITLAPVGAQYEVTVAMKFSTGGAWKTLFGPFTMPTAAPGTLKMGFAASTGSNTNYHEIRNLTVTQQVQDLIASMAVQNLTTGGGSVAPGDRLRYTVVFSNLTSTAIKDIHFSAAIPARTSYVLDSATAESGAVTFGSATKTLDVAGITVPGDGQARIAFNVLVDANLAGVKQISSQGDYSYRSINSVTDGDTVTEGSQPTVIDVTDGPNFGTSTMTVVHDDVAQDGRVDVGDVLSYHVVLANTGNQNAPITSFAGPIPANTTYVEGSAITSGGVAKLSDTGKSLVWALDVDAGGQATLDFKVTVNAGVLSRNVISGQGAIKAGAVTVRTDADTATPGKQPAEFLIGDVAALTATKTAEVEAGAGISPEDALTYKIVLKNVSSNPVSGATFVDTIPAYATHVSHTTSVGAASYTAPALTVTGIELAAGAEATIALKVKANTKIPTAVTWLSNQGVVNWDSKKSGVNDASLQTDSDPALPGSQPTHTAILPPGARSKSKDVPGGGATLVYTLGVTNTGPTASTSVVLDVGAVAGLAAGACSATQGSYTSPTWDVGTLIGGASATLIISATNNLVQASSPLSDTAKIILRCTGGLGPRIRPLRDVQPGEPRYRARE
jgi:uncharacterized repeat protein (TIGR01451 family)